MTTILQDFTSSTILDDDFTQSNPATGTFTWNNTTGLSSSPGIDVSLGSDQIWTTKQGYTISDNGEYSISAFFQSSANNGYGALGFSIQSQDSNAGSFGAPGGSHIGAFFHGGGGGFLSNGAIDATGASTGGDSPISWNNGGVQADGSWYNFIFTTTAQGGNKYDLNLKIYNATASGVVGSLITEHSMTDNMADSARVGPAITNANVGGAGTLHTFFSANGSRMTSIDDFQIDLDGDTLLLEPGPPTVDLNGSADGANNTATFTEVAGADDGSAVVSFTSGATNLGDLDSANLNNLKVSIPVASVKSGDELRLDATTVDITDTVTTGEVSYNGTFFSYAIADAAGTRTITFTSLSGTGGADTASALASYEALLDAIKYNNTTDFPATNPTRVFSVTADDASSTSDVATFTVTLNNAPAQLTYDTTTFVESAADDGSITSTATITLAGDAFTGVNGDNLGAVTNVPPGLVAALIKASDTTATLSFTGNANAHTSASDINNLTVTFADADFTNNTAVNIPGSTTSNLVVDFTSSDFDPFIKGQSSVSVNEDASVSINGFTVSDDDNPARLKIKMDVDHGDLLLGTTTGISGTTSGASIEFSGSIADLNTALNSLSYQGNTEYSGADDITIQVSDDDGATWHGYFVDEVGKFYYPLNKHYYEFISAPGITWTDAKTAAEANTLYGLSGYLMTATSAAENNFITPKLGGQGWIGASDATVEGEWFWETGPESGTQFWSGASSGSVVGGEYNNWDSGEPNNSGNEDYGHFLTNGEWNDFVINNANIKGYVVEYGGDGTGNDGFGTLQAVPLEITVNNVNDAPVINNLGGDTASTAVNQAIFLDVGTANSITDVDTTDFDGGTLIITTTSGTADGNFSLDGTNATAGGNSVITANDMIAVGASDIGVVHATNDGQAGNTLTITLNGNATLSNVSQLIKNISYISATAGTRDFNLALSESDGKTDNATFSVQVFSGDITYSNTTFNESNTNNGAISTTLSISLVGDTFTGANGDNLGLVTNIPAGLTAALVKASDTTATLNLTGNATAHANVNDINNLTVTFTDADFTGGAAANIANALKSNLVVNFSDPISSGGGGGSSDSDNDDSGNSSESDSNGGSSTTIDGLVVDTSTTTNGDTTTSTTTVPVVSSTRIEDPATENAMRADIPLVTNNDDQVILQVSLPNGVGLISEETTGTVLTLREKLIAASDPKIDDTQVFDEILQRGIDAYVPTVTDQTQVTLRTVTFSASERTDNLPIIVSGALGTGEDDLNNPLRQEALVIDTRNLLPDTEIQFDKTEFAIVIGSTRIIGGEGRNFIVGDDANQFFVSGEGDDRILGGFGDDTIGARDGNDLLFGDAGNDYLIGGLGDDMLEGGDGDDLLQGGQSDAGTLTFSLNDQNQVVSTFTIEDPALSSPSTLNTESSWFSNNVPITNDNRVSFVYRDSQQLETLSILSQSVLDRLPTTEEMNMWTQQVLPDNELGEIAYQVYLDFNGDITPAPVETQMAQLLTHVWGEDQVNSDWVNLGIEHINNGGSWSDALLFMARHDNLKSAILDNNGALKLTQNLQTSETGWSSDTGSDTLIGGQGNDTLVGGYGHNLLDGGSGVDTILVTETTDSHHVVINNDGRIGVHRDDENALDDLVDIENVNFSDQILDVSASNLDPTALKEMAGLANLIDLSTLTLENLNQVNEANMTTIDVSEVLMTTDSYQQNWGTLSNLDFTSKLGNAVLEAPLTDLDLSFWVNQLDQGAIGRDEMMVIAVGVAEYQDSLFAEDGLLLL